MKRILTLVLTIIFFTTLPLVVFTLITSKTPILGGIRSFVVLTGSMEPNIPQGSLIFTQPQKEYKVGDVISFNKNDVNVTHRVVDISTLEAKSWPEYITKGDANNVKDSGFILPNAILGKQIFFVPYLGKFTLFLRTLPGFILFIILPTLIFIGFELLNIKKELVKKIEKEVAEKLNLEQK